MGGGGGGGGGDIYIEEEGAAGGTYALRLLFCIALRGSSFCGTPMPFCNRNMA